MNVPNIDRGSVSSAGPPRIDTSIALTRLAWFDADGDGRIDPRAAGSGGDATLLVPAHQVDLPTYGRVAHPAAGSHQAKAEQSAANPAQTERAVAAYQRYGEPAAPSTSVAAVPTAVADATSAAAFAAPVRAVA